ncbi:MAG: hypothetical protein ABI689_02805 [Thermoanaerobaculia bacterium]
MCPPLRFAAEEVRTHDPGVGLQGENGAQVLANHHAGHGNTAVAGTRPGK